MRQSRRSAQDRALSRQYADNVLAGRVETPAPRPQSIGYYRPKIEPNLFASPLPPPQSNLDIMHDGLGGQGDARQVGEQSQARQAPPPIVIVIDDSEDEEEVNNEAVIAGNHNNHHENKGVHQRQQAQRQFSAQQAGEDDEALLARQNQQLQEAQGQTLALLDLPEVNIPRKERFKTPRALRCELLPHQRVGLTWLIRQEEDPNKKGSILADGMGLGKTVEALALILSRKFNPDQSNCKTTLILAPLGLLQQWSDEISSKVTLRHGNKLSTIIFHGLGPKRVTADQLLEYDIVLCTYGKLVSEYNMYTKGQRNRCKLLAEQTKFYRVVLDEAHFIKNKNTQTSKAVCQLQAIHRLCMTGTPLMNTVTELYPLIRFLGIQPYNNWQKFSEDVDRPIRGWQVGMESPAMLRLQALVRSLVLRRHKDSYLDNRRIIDLKKRTDVEVFIKFGDEQQAFYNALELKQKLKFNKYLKEGTVMKNYMIILTWILRKRQACDHPYLIQNHCIPDVCDRDAEGMINLALQLPVHIQNSIRAIQEFNCPKCEHPDPAQNITRNPVIISPCGHYICAGCYAKLMEESAIPAAEGVAAEDVDECSRFKCPNEGCTSTIGPNNILMHNFFVDAHRDEDDIWNDEPVDDDFELAELDSEDEDEGIDYHTHSQASYLIPSVEHHAGSSPPTANAITSKPQSSPGFSGDPYLDGREDSPGLYGDPYFDEREDSPGLFVDPYPDEPDIFGEASPRSDGGSVIGDELRPLTTQASDALLEFEAPQGFRSTPELPNRPSPRPSPDVHSESAQVAATPAPIQSTSQPPLPPKGHRGNPVDIDDEKEEAVFTAVSRIMAEEANSHRDRRIKDESENELTQASDIPNYDGSSSPAPPPKRMGPACERVESELKRARTASLQSHSNGGNSRRSRSDMDIEFEARSPSPGARVNTADPENSQQARDRSPSLVILYEGIVDPDRGDQQASVALPKIEDEDIKPDIHHMGHRARDTLQKPFVSLSDKRQIADKNQRAMAAYQKRVASEWVASAKTEKVIELLQTIKRDHPGDKTLIFSLWTVFLDMLEPPLREAKFKYTVYTGGMKTDNRTAAVQTFMTNPELDVMLISLSAGSCGLNLTAANHVILTEPFWNPFTEEQAIDRAHRLGQTKEVTVYRLLVKGTIEDHIMSLQRKKKDLVGAALCDATADSPLNKLNMEDLRDLFGV